MNIKEFKAGDVITRNQPVSNTYSETPDSSYCGDKIILEGHDSESKIIFFTLPNNSCLKDIYDISYAREPWDEGWCKYPTSMLEKIKTKFSKK